MRAAGSRNRRQAGVGSIFWQLAALAVSCGGGRSAAVATSPPPASAPATAPVVTAVRGIVFDDRDRDGKRGAGEQGLADVRVSNGREIVATDPNGRYELAVDNDDIIFVIKPRNWMIAVDADQVPRFYRVHKPFGTQVGGRYAGVAPTPPLPESLDFPLVAQREGDELNILVFGDTQPRDLREVEYIAHDVIEPLIGYPADFGVTLGDVVFDNLAVFEPLQKSMAKIGVPWFLVHGNHDMNLDAPDDATADETWERLYGPATYSFDWGPAHFVILDDVAFHGAGHERQYHGEFGDAQLAWLKRDLAFVPPETLCVLMVHIPIPRVRESEALFCRDRAAFYEVLAEQPKSLTLSAHTHILEHIFVGPDDGWRGPEKHHHYNAGAVCGSWWAGMPDEYGIPHTMMRCGGPNGWSVLKIRGAEYEVEYFAARRPASHQMAIFLPEEIPAASVAATELVVNVFAGSERSVVEYRVEGFAEWKPMARKDMLDPAWARLKALEKDNAALPGRKLNDNAVESRHIWVAPLGSRLSPGTHVVHVRTRDMFGHEYADRRIFRVGE